MNEYDITELPVQREIVTTNVNGTAITPEEVANRLSDNLYRQLSENDDSVTQERIQSAQVYVSAILKKFNVKFNLNDTVIREIVILNTIYEMHIGHGHEEAGKEYRARAKDLILVTWGDYKDSDNSAADKVPVSAVSSPRGISRYGRAFQVDQGRSWKSKIR